MKQKAGIFHIGTGGMIGALLAIHCAGAVDVVPRGTTANRVSATRPTMAAARMPTMTVNPSVVSVPSATDTAPAAETPATNTATPANDTATPAIENKSSMFGTGLSAESDGATDTAANNLAELIRAQRAALDIADTAAAATTATSSTGSGENACDAALRECMIGKCGTDFSNCAGDTDTTFFDKMDTCRRGTNCTGHEYSLFSAEIRADRDTNAKLANYNAIISCGNNYNDCIVAQCGRDFTKCMGRTAGDAAIAKCDNIARGCTQYDSGLAMRAMAVFGEVRGVAERSIAAGERELYALRDEMRALCTRLGAMFDERSLDCVYTVNFRAAPDSTLYASKKTYAGGTFDCTPNWFGVDVTTYRENAMRATRAQTAASGAMLGSGLGQGLGAITSGAIDRAAARFNAENALDDAINECIEAYGADAPECQAKIKEKEETTTTKSGTATQLPADIENTLKDIQERQDQEINNMVIDYPDITDGLPDPLEDNFTVDSRQHNATEDESEHTDIQPVEVDNSAIESKKQRQKCTLKTLAGTDSKQCFKKYDNIPDDAIKKVQLFVGKVNATTKNDTTKPELREISEVLPETPDAFQIIVVFPSITQEKEMESTCDSLNQYTFCNIDAACKVSTTTFGTDDSTKQYGCSLFYNYKKNKHQ